MKKYFFNDEPKKKRNMGKILRWNLFFLDSAPLFLAFLYFLIRQRRKKTESGEEKILNQR